MKILSRLSGLALLLLLACGSQGLTKTEALAVMKQMEVERPMQTTRFIPVGQVSLKNSGSGVSELNKLRQLEQQGVITITTGASKTLTFGTRTEVHTIYTIAIKPQYQNFIIKQQGNSAQVQTAYRDTKSILEVNMVNERQAIVTAEFEKVKTPFYDASSDNALLKSRNGVYSHKVKFRKSDTGKWSCDWLDSEGI
ncbi:hypothetical protein ACFQ1Q_01660 [Winogradskyella litorisediminis]|uniref:Lipoprotein n=1 Tax=Winogradskyella litorisediminis TaxID=1156618 RepID=A0ABW3N325_9FLAO